MSFRGDVRDVVDPMFIRFREELMGSGVSFGRLQESSLPVTVVYTTTVQPIIDGAGYVKGVTTQSSGTTVGTNQKTLRFYGATLFSLGDTTTIIIPSGGAGSGSGLANPMTTLGDIIYGGVAGTPTRLPVGASGTVLTVVTGVPTWAQPLSTVLTTAGDILYKLGGNVVRLPIGNAGDILTVSNGLPAWLSPASGTDSSIIIKTRDNVTSAVANTLITQEGGLRASGDTVEFLLSTLLPIDVPPTSPHAKDDEFSAPSLNARWTDPITSAATNTITFNGSHIVIESSTTGTGSSSKRGAFGIRQIAPSGSFTISAKITDGTGDGGTDDARTGVFVAITGGKAHVFGRQSSVSRLANAIGVTTYSESTDWSTYDGFDAYDGTNPPGTAWYRIKWDAAASTLSFYWSTSGVFWQLLTTRTGQSQPDRIGICIYANTANIGADHKLGCDWFRVTEP